MDKKLKLLPIGIATFDVLRREHFLYVDKTKQIYNLVTRGRYYFLSRPRRFGKSLLMSTLKALFEGKKELFEGLWISTSDYAWKEYAVIHLDFFEIARNSVEELELGLEERLHYIAKSYGIDIAAISTLEQKFATLIREMSKKNPVVVLIDEYDHAILNNISDLKAADECRKILQSFYGILKSLGEHLHFVFLTGVTKFAKTSIFSGLNNLNDLTMKESTAALLGYTHQELLDNFDEYIQSAATKLKQSPEELVATMTEWYDGYQFSDVAEIEGQSVKVYNPWSVLSFFEENKFSNYWFQSGSPRFLIDVIKRQQFQPIELNNLYVGQDQIGAFEIDKIFLPTLLYQTGYLTIEFFDSEDERYKLKIPNVEVERSLFKQLLINCTPLEESATGPLLS